MRRKRFILFLLLFMGYPVLAQPIQGGVECNAALPYSIQNSQDYAYRKLRNEGIETMARQLDVLRVPIRPFKAIITGHTRLQKSFFQTGHNSRRCIGKRAVKVENNVHIITSYIAHAGFRCE